MTAEIAVLRQEVRLLEELVSHFPVIPKADHKTQWRFLHFFTATIQNPYTREADALFQLLLA